MSGRTLTYIRREPACGACRIYKKILTYANNEHEKSDTFFTAFCKSLNINAASNTKLSQVFQPLVKQKSRVYERSSPFFPYI